MKFLDIIDISAVAVIIYFCLLWFKRTRAAFIFTGILITAGLYLVARQFQLELTSSLFEAFFAVILIALVVIFQEELRRLFERLAYWGLNPRFRRQQLSLSEERDEEAQMLAKTSFDLALRRIGALIVLPGRDAIMRHITGGRELDGLISEPLLKSIFDPHSLGHDGAVVVQKGRVSHFSGQLPLSKEMAKLKGLGTRHAAALGLSELADALCIVVSEERGIVSITRNGNLIEAETLEALKEILSEFHHELRGGASSMPFWKKMLKRNLREKGAALGLALLLWFVLVYGKSS